MVLPEQLLLLVLATALVWLLGAHHPDSPLHLPVVGEVPKGLPSPQLPSHNVSLVIKMLQPALVVGIFSFILSMSIVRTFAIKYDYEADSNQVGPTATCRPLRAARPSHTGRYTSRGRSLPTVGCYKAVAYWP